jgi:hypothetical protein
VASARSVIGVTAGAIVVAAGGADDVAGTADTAADESSPHAAASKVDATTVTAAMDLDNPCGVRRGGL